MTNSILLQNVSPEELTELIKEAVKTQLDDFKKSFNIPNSDDLLTREQTCDFLQINASTLWHWTNKGKVKSYSISSKLYYKRSELLLALKQNQTT